MTQTLGGQVPWDIIHWKSALKSNVSRFGLAVRRYAGKQKGLGSNLLRFSFLFKKVVVCGHCLVSLSLTIMKH